jgi:hypothetical protein
MIKTSILNSIYTHTESNITLKNKIAHYLELLALQAANYLSN